MLIFACLAPHPPIILPGVGSPEDREKVKKTISSLEKLGVQLAKTNPERIVITSPHQDWGFNVPLHFLAKDVPDAEIIPHQTNLDSPQIHFEKGKNFIRNLEDIDRLAWIASGDMSHRLKDSGPYGFHVLGPKFDEQFINLLRQKNVQGILNLDPKLVEEAGECGLRSFCMLLGALEKSGLDWTPEILSYEYPFGVGYLVANIRIKNSPNE